MRKPTCSLGSYNTSVLLRLSHTHTCRIRTISEGYSCRTGALKQSTASHRWFVVCSVPGHAGGDGAYMLDKYEVSPMQLSHIEHTKLSNAD